MKRLLILSVSAGAGHTRAAMALELEARALWPETEVVHEDVLDFTQSIYRKGYVRSYLEMVNRAPELWGIFVSRERSAAAQALEPRLVRLFDRLEFGRLPPLRPRFCARTPSWRRTFFPARFWRPIGAAVAIAFRSDSF